VSLPPPRKAGSTYRIAVVCLGNICRSPVAAVVLEAKIDAAGMSGRVQTRSSGIGDWHVGDPMDRRAAASLAAAGYDPSVHRAAQFGRPWFADNDAILAMDAGNFRDLVALAPDEEARDRIRMFREFDPQRDPTDPDDLDVPDPWYGGLDGFETVLDIVERTTDQLLVELQHLP
jgi:protein-tyrosine phosphatase